MAEKTHTYENEDIVVEYRVKRCIHAAECVKGLPAVFDPERRPWIDPAKASPDEIERVVGKCPSGALTLNVKGRESTDIPETENEILVEKDGPLFIRGHLKLNLADGTTAGETRVALCRCGASQNRPYCDNSHIKSGFQDEGKLGTPSLSPEGPQTDTLEVSLAPNGPLLIQGLAIVRGSDQGTPHTGSKGALCRCGKSQNKPYCDGSHKPASFEAE
jgi:CDGSH-type Zn-finger protein/uncharacterized Fe-S cluster protein YjdI